MHDLSKENLATSVMPFCTCYSDTGLFGLYAVASETNNLDDLSLVMLEEMVRGREIAISRARARREIAISRARAGRGIAISRARAGRGGGRGGGGGGGPGAGAGRGARRAEDGRAPGAAVRAEGGRSAGDCNLGPWRALGGAVGRRAAGRRRPAACTAALA